MADSKISALTDGSPAALSDLFVIARGSSDYKLSLAKLLAAAELDYVERTTNLSVAATTAAGADTFIDGNAVTYDGSTRIKVEFFSPLTDSTQFVSIDLWDGSTDLGVIAQSNGVVAAIYGVRFLTPSAASHTFHIKAWRGTGSATVQAGAGGAGTRVPAWYRITKA